MPELPLLGGLPATGLQLFASELLITITNGQVWLSIGLALFLGAGCLAFGTWVARTVGLLDRETPAAETLGVGLSTGLVVLATWWATIWSGGRSSFTAVAVGFAVALIFAFGRRARTTLPATRAPQVDRGNTETFWLSNVRMARAALLGGAFVVAIALLYGSTLAPSPRDGVQPMEFSDEAFYAVLGRDLAITGIETNLAASGFSDLPGLPEQTWYHWGETWLASAVITTFGTEPMAARYLVVLPLVLLAAAGLTGTLVRRLAGRTARRAYVFGVVACLFLAPIPVPGTYFSSWATGLIFTINLYGLSVVAVLLAMYCIVVLAGRRATWALASFVGGAVAVILPTHIVMAALATFGIAAAGALRVGQSLVATHRLPAVPNGWRSVAVASVVLLITTLVWAALTGHGLGGTASSPNGVLPFNPAWALTVASVYLGAATLLAIPIAGLLLRGEAPLVARMSLATAAIVVFGAIAWGARLGDFNMYHVFFGAIAVFGAPVAAVAAWMLFERLRRSSHERVAAAAAILCVIQLGIGIATAAVRLQQFGPRLHNDPVSISVLDAIRRLPTDAKLAYACRPFEEFAFTDPSLLGIDAHTGRRVVPMCFQADVFRTLNGLAADEQVPDAGFSLAPQSILYPNATARPSPAEVAAFLKAHGIHYIYADGRHPNSLVPEAILTAASGDQQVLRIP